MNDKEKLEEIDKIILDKTTGKPYTFHRITFDEKFREIVVPYTDEEKLEQIYRILHSTKNYEESPA